MSAVIEVSNVSGAGVILEVSATQPGFLVSVEATAIDVPSAPALDGGSVAGDTFLNLFAPLDDDYVTHYEWLLDGAPVEPAVVTGLSSFEFTGDQSGKVFLVRAVNAAGPGPYSDPITVP